MTNGITIGIIILLVLFVFGRESIDNFGTPPFGVVSTINLLKQPLQRDSIIQINRLEQELENCKNYQKDSNNTLHTLQHTLLPPKPNVKDYPPILKPFSKLHNSVSQSILSPFKKIGNVVNEEFTLELYARPVINKWQYYVQINNHQLPLDFDHILKNNVIITIKDKQFKVQLD
jgi:hypothetical protein